MWEPVAPRLAGVNAKALSTFIGHATIAVTLDLYGHLFPGSEDEAASLLDDYLTRASEQVEEAASSGGLVETSAFRP